VTPGYRIASAVVVLLAGLTIAAAQLGWGLDDDVALRARSARQGSLRGRHVYGGGPSFGK
jgi:hypothetical protein